MRFLCSGCGIERDFELDFSLIVIEKWGNGIKRYCKSCRSPRSGVVDVFWDGKPEENLADGPDGKPITFFSKGHKAEYLKSRGIMEAGDRVHGAPIQVSKNQERLPVDSRHEARMALKRVKEMGKDVRRQAYLKVMKENGGRYEGKR